ncbi:MAG: hypothetical protein J0J06_06420 [Sphingomonas sp.]|uniref:hypothetical protein n=1 Tax=Sphingomonas sp. TaxID=28214 RepID=UPI001ACFC656|nr:hypothetical protein [Sphingomonas sp.]MBN8815064.1 hypothetical protein [Sphingomonas sp.]
MIERALIAVLLSAMPAAALAQSSAPAAPNDDIVVRDRRTADRKAVERYVGEISVRTDTQLARFHQPICPVVIGLPRDYAAIVERRIVADALAAGMSVDRKTKCSPNLIVVIAENGSALVADIRRRRSGWLEGLTAGEIDALIAPAPARAWSVTSLRNEDGQGLKKTRDEAGPNPLGGIPTLRVMSASIIKAPTRQDMEASFVVIDEAATVGFSLRQIADYAAMRGLAHTRPPAPGGTIDTILTLLDGSPTPPRSLTATDSAYLRALYASDGRSAAVTERSAIARRIAKGK